METCTVLHCLAHRRRAEAPIWGAVQGAAELQVSGSQELMDKMHEALSRRETASTGIIRSSSASPGTASGVVAAVSSAPSPPLQHWLGALSLLLLPPRLLF